MSIQCLSVPRVQINGDTWYIIVGSFKYDAGEGEVNVRAVSAGGRNIETIHTYNVETAISVITFDVPLIPSLDTFIDTWKSNPGGNIISIYEEFPVTGEDYLRVFPGCSLTAVVEREASPDGKASLEWKGNPMLIG